MAQICRCCESDEFREIELFPGALGLNHGHETLTKPNRLDACVPPFRFV
jgi:hypothetical protein